jgi:hypothetical protein
VPVLDHPHTTEAAEEGCGGRVLALDGIEKRAHLLAKGDDPRTQLFGCTKRLEFAVQPCSCELSAALEPLVVFSVELQIEHFPQTLHVTILIWRKNYLCVAAVEDFRICQQGDPLAVVVARSFELSEDKIVRGNLAACEPVRQISLFQVVREICLVIRLRHQRSECDAKDE